jgi:hypothetical protein
MENNTAGGAVPGEKNTGGECAAPEDWHERGASALLECTDVLVRKGVIWRGVRCGRFLKIHYLQGGSGEKKAGRQKAAALLEWCS